MSLQHAIMENLTHGFEKPGIMDVKVSYAKHFIAQGYIGSYDFASHVKSSLFRIVTSHFNLMF